jgi:hypothetical protein
MRYSQRLKAISFLISTSLIVSLGLSSPASAAQTLTLIAEESFDYSGNIVGKNGGSGFTNAWQDAYYNSNGSSNYSIQTPGLTYSGLTTAGGYMYSCSSTPNQVCGVSRQIPTQSSGVLYIQMLVNFGSQRGGGTPNIRLSDGSGTQSGGFGYGDGAPSPGISIMNAALTPLSDGSSTAGTLNALNLVIIRIDYSANRSTMYLNPDLATFSYLSPPTASATYPNFAPEVKTLSFFARNGVQYDEVKIYTVTGTSAADDEAAAKAAAENARKKRDAEIKTARERINYLLTTNGEVTPKDLSDADLPLKSVDSLHLAYKELISIKYSLTAPLSPEALAEIKFNKFMKYAMYERMTGISRGDVFGRDLVKFGIIPAGAPMKQLTTYQLMKQPISVRDSIAEVNDFFNKSASSFAERKARLVAIIAKIQRS